MKKPERTIVINKIHYRVGDRFILTNRIATHKPIGPFQYLEAGTEVSIIAFDKGRLVLSALDGNPVEHLVIHPSNVHHFLQRHPADLKTSLEDNQVRPPAPDKAVLEMLDQILLNDEEEPETTPEDEPEDVIPPREERNNKMRDTLTLAGDTIFGPREAEYGDKQTNFTNIATGWSAITGTPLTAKQVALMMAWLKIARLSSSPDHTDSWIDLAGYAAIGSGLDD